MNRFELVSLETATQFNTVPENLYLSDENKQLMLVHYCDMKNWKRTKPHDSVLPYRGWIVDKNTRKVVARSFEWSPEYVVSDPREINSAILTVGRQGTILRAFWHNDTFYLSTHRRISCEKSKWGNKVPFLKMIQEAEERMKIKLSDICKKGTCYVLLLVHPENQTVKTKLSIEPTIYHLDSWKEGVEPDQRGITRMVHSDEKLEELPSFPYLSKEEAVQAFHDDLMLISKDRDGVTTKYVPERLQKKLDIRGQIPNLYYCWFMWMYSKQQQDLMEIIPEHQKGEMVGFEQRFNDEKKELTDYLYHCYTNRTQNIHPSHHNLVKQLHNIYNNRKAEFFSHKGNVEKKFFWGKNKVETERNIRKAIEMVVINAEPSSVYKAIVEIKKMKHEQNKVEQTE